MADQLNFLVGDDVFGFAPGQNVAISLKDGKIELVTRLMPEEAGLLIQAEGEKLLDCRGKLVLPGLIDAHTHAIATGLMLLSPVLHEARSLDEVVAAIRQGAQSDPPVVRLGSLDSSRFQPEELGKLNRKWLDDVLPDRPLFIKSVEGHSSWFNTKGWELINIDAALDTAGVAEADQQQMRKSGRVYGLTYENLTTPIYDTYTHEERREAMLKVIEKAQGVGLVGLHCLEGYGEYRRNDFELILELDEQCDIDLTLYCRDATPRLAEKLGVNRFGGCWCLDGAIGAHTAAIAEPYVDKQASLGDLYFSDQELTAWFEAGLQKDMQPCVHAIGERALEQAVRCLESLAGMYDLPKLRPRVDHWVLGTPGLAERAAGIGIVGAMQPAFDAKWGGEHDGYSSRLGAQRALRTNPVGMMLAAGLLVAGSSDSYITPLDPVGGIRAAMNHHNAECRVKFDTAVSLFSSNAAYLSHDDRNRGKIEAGYQADFTVIADSRQLENEGISATIKGGSIVYSGN